MNLHGKGQQFRKDIISMTQDSKNIDVFDKKYNIQLRNLVFDNFIYPLIYNKDNKDKQKEVVGKLDLFCAAFYNPI